MDEDEEGGHSPPPLEDSQEPQPDCADSLESTYTTLPEDQNDLDADSERRSETSELASQLGLVTVSENEEDGSRTPTSPGSIEDPEVKNEVARAMDDATRRQAAAELRALHDAGAIARLSAVFGITDTPIEKVTTTMKKIDEELLREQENRVALLRKQLFGRERPTERNTKPIKCNIDDDGICCIPMGDEIIYRIAEVKENNRHITSYIAILQSKNVYVPAAPRAIFIARTKEDVAEARKEYRLLDKIMLSKYRPQPPGLLSENIVYTRKGTGSWTTAIEWTHQAFEPYPTLSPLKDIWSNQKTHQKAVFRLSILNVFDRERHILSRDSRAGLDIDMKEGSIVRTFYYPLTTGSFYSELRCFPAELLKPGDSFDRETFKEVRSNDTKWYPTGAVCDVKADCDVKEEDWRAFHDQPDQWGNTHKEHFKRTDMIVDRLRAVVAYQLVKEQQLAAETRIPMTQAFLHKKEPSAPYQVMVALPQTINKEREQAQHTHYMDRNSVKIEVGRAVFTGTIDGSLEKYGNVWYARVTLDETTRLWRNFLDWNKEAISVVVAMERTAGFVLAPDLEDKIMNNRFKRFVEKAMDDNVEITTDDGEPQENIPLLRIYMGKKPTVDKNLEKYKAYMAEIEEILNQGNLDEYQKKAVLTALHPLEKLILMESPAGTGKTTTIAEIIWLLTQQLEKKVDGAPEVVVAAAVSNQAVRQMALALGKYINPSEPTYDPNIRPLIFVSESAAANPRELADNRWLLDYTVPAAIMRIHNREVTAPAGVDVEKLPVIYKSLYPQNASLIDEYRYVVAEKVEKKHRDIIEGVIEHILVNQKKNLILSTLDTLQRQKQAFKKIKRLSVVLDEAGQLSELSFIGLAVWHQLTKVTLVGDTIQKGPFAPAGNMEDLKPVQCSAMSLAETRNAATVCFLENGYRLHPLLTNLIDKAFYGGRYIPAIAESSRNLVTKHQNKRIWLPAPTPLLMVDLEGEFQKLDDSTSKRNPEQCEAGLQVAQKLVALDVPDTKILCFYKADEYYLRDRIKELNLQGRVTAMTADSSQGGECDAAIVITSTVEGERSKFAQHPHLTDKGRLVVAMTRARHFCCLIGALKQLQKAKPFQLLFEAAEQLGVLPIEGYQLSNVLDGNHGAVEGFALSEEAQRVPIDVNEVLVEMGKKHPSGSKRLYSQV